MRAFAGKVCVLHQWRGNLPGGYANGREGDVENYPTPDELWNETFAETNAWRDRFAGVPFEDKGGTWEARYYQHNAINKTLEAIASGKDRSYSP